MKFFGKKPKGPDEQIISFPRNDCDINFVVRGVIDYSTFFALCPPPEAPKLRLPGDKFKEDVENPVFKSQLQAWCKKQTDWMHIESIRYTPGLEFELINLSEPETWCLLDRELTDLHLTWIEKQNLQIAIAQVNGMNEERVQEARMRFLATLQQGQNGQSCQKEEQSSTSSGDAVSDGVSNLSNSTELPAGMN